MAINGTLYYPKVLSIEVIFKEAELEDGGKVAKTV